MTHTWHPHLFLGEYTVKFGPTVETGGFSVTDHILTLSPTLPAVVGATTITYSATRRKRIYRYSYTGIEMHQSIRVPLISAATNIFWGAFGRSQWNGPDRFQNPDGACAYQDPILVRCSAPTTKT